MEFSYQTRQKYADACVGEWEKQHPLKRKLLSRELCDLMEEIQTLGTSADNRAKKIEQFWEAHKGECTLSAFMKKYCKPLVELYVPKDYLEDYYRIIDQFQNFQYTAGAYRRTIRT
ncbi:MAG: hypothetical protein ACI4L2_06325 [Wujia sp.]